MGRENFSIDITAVLHRKTDFFSIEGLCQIESSNLKYSICDRLYYKYSKTLKIMQKESDSALTKGQWQHHYKQEF